jgi:hypothetical protein
MSLADLTRNAKSAERTRRRIKREGLTMKGDKVWTAEEDEVVRTTFPDYQAIRRVLPHRTYFACRTRARTLELVTKRPPYTARELSVVRRLYPTAEREVLMPLMPGRTWDQIANLAKRHGIHRAPKPFYPTGVTVLDQIRTRCRELNYTMPDLDKLIRSRGYFAKANWYNGHIHHRDIGRAINALFGDLKADWK